MAKERFWKNPKYGMVYSQYFKTPEGLLFWLHLEKPKDGPPGDNGEPGKPRFEASICFPKKSAKTFLASLENDREPMLALYNTGSKGGKMAIEEEDLLIDGETLDTVKYPFLKDTYVITARNAKQIGIVGPDGKSDIEYKALEPGMNGILVVTPFICSHGMKYRLELVQFTSDTGVRVGGARPNPGSMLDIVDSEDVALPVAKKSGKDARDQLSNILG